ncbi:unnamed protein product [Dibothriocephalus latus]|uniref:Uncharacterized protein n=1 Tax=Dibothriocephalus latus TaxID=60516 RepID=A0A3P7M255_DIBLA|nr:unnamed protein product [Dibothriocephalus latus]
MDGVERSGKVKKQTAEFKDPSQCEYLIHTYTPSAKSGLVGSRPRVAHRLESPEGNNSISNSEDLQSNADEANAMVVLTSCLTSSPVDRHKDA